MQAEDERQWVEVTASRIIIKHKEKHFLSEGGGALEQAAQRGCNLSVLGGRQDLTGSWSMSVNRSICL